MLWIISKMLVIFLIFAWDVPLVSLIFLKRSLVFPILLFSSISLHWSLRKAFLFQLVIWNSAFKWVYISFSPLPFTSLLFSAIYKPSSGNYLPFCIFFSWGWSWSLPPWSLQSFGLPPKSQNSVHSSSSTLSNPIPWIYLSLPLYNRKGFDLAHTWMV